MHLKFQPDLPGVNELSVIAALNFCQSWTDLSSTAAWYEIS